MPSVATATALCVHGIPAWAADDPDRACPAKLGDLDRYVPDVGSGPDPWHPYRMYCGAGLPPGAHGFAVSSDNTSDDIVSWTASGRP